MSDHPCEPRYQKMIDKAFVGELTDERWRELFAHLAECDGCRAYHDRLGLIDEAMAAGPLPGSMRARIAQRVITAGAPPPRARLSFGTIVSYASAAAVVVLAVMLPFAVRDGEFTARGGESKWGGRPPGLSLFCITPPASPADAALVDRTVQAAPEGRPPPVLPCRLDQDLQIAYSTPADRPLFLTVEGETEAEPHWYAPRSPDEGPVRLELDAAGRALGWSTRLAVHHEVGTVRVVARFFDDPTGETAVEQLVALLEVRPEE